MYGRLRYWISAAVAVYGLWMVVLLALYYQHSRAMIVGSVGLGTLAALFTVLSITPRADELFRPSWLLFVLLLGMFGALYGTFTLRDDSSYRYVTYFGERVIDYAGLLGYLARYWAIGALFGVAAWMMGSVQVALTQETRVGYLFGVAVTLMWLFIAPQMRLIAPNLVLFTMAFTVVRLVGQLWAEATTLETKGLIFGVVLGMLYVLLPFAGYYSYGLIIQ